MLSPTKLVQSAIDIGMNVAKGAVGTVRRALGGTEAEPEPPARKPAARKPAAPKRSTSPPPVPKPEITDTALARKVETELFRPLGAPRDSVGVECAGRVVTLRGEVPTLDLIHELEAAATAVAEVQRVENLLRLTQPLPPVPLAEPAPLGGEGPREP